MIRFRLLLPWLLAALFSVAAVADEPRRPDHFRGEPAETLEQAVKNFSEYNTKLEAVLAADSLDLVRLNEVHQLTYTLENALQKMQQDLAQLAQTLEAIHVASEHADSATVKREGEQYLRVSRILVE
ncbi:MAG: DUF6746 family protein [Lysobacteraceae bacterium]